MRDLLLAAEKIRSVEWREGAIHVLDQRALPAEQVWISCENAVQVVDAIKVMAVRGASLIAICAAYAVVMSVRARFSADEAWLQGVFKDIELLEVAQPGNLFLLSAMSCMREMLLRCEQAADLIEQLESEAIALHERDREANLSMAELAVGLIQRHQAGVQSLMTHGHTGALATGGFGTALAAIRAARHRGLIERVYVDEGQPQLSASLTVWELAIEEIPAAVVADLAVAHLMKVEPITWLILAADRVAANGDVVAAIGSYQLAVLAMHHGVRVMVVASSASIDLATPHADDVEQGGDTAVEVAAGAEVKAFNPECDVIPADLVDFLVTERGVIDRPDAEKMAHLMCRKRLH
jgi:methylthioribose-1-phosphate isomerase